jgi:hypothetical protein
VRVGGWLDVPQLAGRGTHLESADTITSADCSTSTNTRLTCPDRDVGTHKVA